MAEDRQPQLLTVAADDYDSVSEYSAEIISSDLEPPKETLFSSVLEEKSAGISLDLSLSSSSSSSSFDRTVLAMAKPNSNHIRHGRFHYKDFKEGVGKSKLYKHYLRAMGISEKSRHRKSATFDDTIVEPSSYSEMVYESLDFGCNFCGRRFHNAQALGGHQNAHKQERHAQRIARRSHVSLRHTVGTNTSVSMLRRTFSDQAIKRTGPAYSLAEKSWCCVDSANNLQQSHVGSSRANPKYSFNFNGYTISDENARFQWLGNLKNSKETTNLKKHTNLSAEERSGNPGILLKTIQNSERISVLDLSLRL